MSDTPKHDDMEVRHAAAAGLDVHKMQVTATVRTHAGREGPLVETREFSALASGLALLVQWLLGLRVSGAVMEATGVYWEKVYDILSDAGLDVMVVNAQHVKQIKGRKTDIADSVWLSRICQFGLGSPSLVLPKSFRDLRGLSRYRRTLIEQRARAQLRIQKVLDRGGVRIGGVLSRITGRGGPVGPEADRSADTRVPRRIGGAPPGRIRGCPGSRHAARAGPEPSVPRLRGFHG